MHLFFGLLVCAFNLPELNKPILPKSVERDVKFVLMKVHSSFVWEMYGESLN
jgi:hypothetical protein